MEINETYELEPKPLKVYSKLAIRGFSIFFSTIFGGVLLMYNLKAIGNRRAANQVLIFSIIYTIFSFILLNSMNKVGGSAVYFINIVGSVILTEYFYKKHLPANDYYPKPIWKALIISLVIIAPFVIAVVYTIMNP